MTHLRSFAVGMIALIATPAYAQSVVYDMYLEGTSRDTLVLKVDTRKLPRNSIIQPAAFTANVTRNNGPLVPQSYSIARLFSGKVYEWRKKHGVAGARGVFPANINWAARAVGGKADGGEDLAAVAATDVMSADVYVGPPPAAAMITHCKAYSQIAIRQFNDAQRRQCGFSGSRWSPVFRYHYLWCTAVPVHVSNRETEARARSARQCAQR